MLPVAAPSCSGKHIGIKRLAGEDSASLYARGAVRKEVKRMDKNEFHSYDAQGLPLDVQGLIIGADLPVEKVKAEICPECPFKTPLCQWLQKEVWLPDSRVGVVCPGIRAWVTKSN